MFYINICMKSMRHYIKLIEAASEPPVGWIANIMVIYEFPSNAMIPQRAQQIESTIDSILTKHGFYKTGSGSGFYTGDVSYYLDGPDLAKLLATAKKAEAEAQQLANRIQDNNAALGIEGLEISVGGWIVDSDYEKNFSFDQAEELVRRTQQLGKNQ